MESTDFTELLIIKPNKVMNTTPDTSWIAGKYEIQGEKAEINTAYSTVSIGDYFAQGEDADRVIKEIWEIWDRDGEITQDKAIEIWAFNNIW